MPYLQNAGVFLIQTIFGFFIVVFLLRALLIAINAPFNQPICRFVYILTNPVTMPLRNLIPRWRRVEFSSLLIAYLLALLELAAFALLFGAGLSAKAMLLRAATDTLDWIVLIELVAIFGYCLLSFFPAMHYDSNFRLLAQFVDPVVRPFRKLLPPLGGMDFSCWFAAITLVLVRMLVVAPLADLAIRL
ncbi:MAG: YggT family protein [Xanthomonadaceae bacterium]|nr:YggT family protein [Xanthomonadaceae bacterium]MDE1885645.1 YggT family protein [Xanthomonadaceae bacterium]MDE1961938.1 YggT family protein [Xanthomonadaceae bacterium]MDE2085398.1 YggT family protein [Xanthomonadaceae bacterium]MDE2257713.1 YggT family protein [Xanthomonadaceae bacterium]